MKLRFRNSLYITGSRKEEIYDVIVFELESLKMDNITKLEDKIFFQNRFWKFGAFALLMSKADKGIFTIEKQGSDIKVFYESSVSILLDILLVIFFLILGIVAHPVFIFGLFLLIIQMIIQINTIKTGNKLLINKISSHF